MNTSNDPKNPEITPGTNKPEIPVTAPNVPETPPTPVHPEPPTQPEPTAPEIK